MSQHRSLKSAILRRKHRSVLKRFERIKELIKKDKWKEGDSFFGLPKVKVVYMKVKKEKAKPEEVSGEAKVEETKEEVKEEKTQESK